MPKLKIIIKNYIYLKSTVLEKLPPAVGVGDLYRPYMVYTRLGEGIF